jgi:plastocyanin
MFAQSKQTGSRRHIQIALGCILLSALLVTFLATRLEAASAHAASLTPRTWRAVVGYTTNNHAIEGMTFLPGALWVNVGDTITWTVKGADIHTVTFLPPGQLPPPFNQNDPDQANRVNGSHYDGHSYYNSGLMSTMLPPAVPRTYSLTFDVPGDFTYYCLVHPSMFAVVHVRPAGTPYPFSQEAYDRQIATGEQAILRDGHKLEDIAQRSSDNHHVVMIGDGMVGIMRFTPQTIVVRVGQSVTFTNRDPMEPHTVTFGPDQPSNFAPYGNPKAFDGKSPLNSGFIGADPHWFGKSFTVTFVKAGTYAFHCDLHDMMGMVMTIIVKP